MSWWTGSRDDKERRVSGQIQYLKIHAWQPSSSSQLSPSQTAPESGDQILNTRACGYFASTPLYRPTRKRYGTEIIFCDEYVFQCSSYSWKNTSLQLPFSLYTTLSGYNSNGSFRRPLNRRWFCFLSRSQSDGKSAQCVSSPTTKP